MHQIDVRFGVFLNGVEVDTQGTSACVVANSPGNIGHGPALERLLGLFRTEWRGADGYLLLDSDCFPISENWLGSLQASMQRNDKRFAAPVRYENLEPYPHPCALYIDGSALDDPRLRFDATAAATNLLGAQVRDIGAGLQPLAPDLLPLLRSNARNPHPVACAVYNHLFYHHGAGSRDLNFRATHRFQYYSHWHQEGGAMEAARLTGALFADPGGFVDALTRP